MPTANDIETELRRAITRQDIAHTLHLYAVEVAALPADIRKRLNALAEDLANNLPDADD
jgi:hypothetical protein